MTDQVFDTPALIQAMQDNLGINPFTIYCLMTGKPIGRIDPDELEPFLRGDVEQVADDLFVRLIASMRPSIHWNVMREDSVRDLSKSRPIETLAYLLNRLFATPDHLKLPLYARLDEQHRRIRLFQWLTDNYHRESVAGLMFMLLDVDSKMNLSQQSIEITALDLMADTDDSIFTVIEDWYSAKIKEWMRNQKRELDAARWFKGNSLARSAQVSAFFEAKPESKTEQKKRAKRQENRELSDLFDAVMAEAEAQPESEAPIPVPTPAPRPATKIPSFLIRSN